MTTPSTARKAGPYSGTGAQTSYPFTFKVFAASDVKVVVADANGDETVLTLGAQYSVTLNSNQETSPGGTITYPISGSPLPAGGKLSIVGNLPYDQPLDLPSGGNFSPLALENQLDRATIQIQQLKEQVDRAAKVPVTYDAADIEEFTADIVRLADSADNIDTVAQNIVAIDAVAADIAVVADNVADVTNFADVYYGPSATDPATRRDGSALQGGDLYFNTGAQRMRVYAGGMWADGVVNTATTSVQRFSGDGGTVAFTLATDPVSENNTQVFIGGVYQQKDTYSVSGTTLTFNTAPPAGTNNIEVVSTGTVAGFGTLPASAVTADDGAGGSLWTTVAGFIARIVSSAGSSVVGFVQAGTGAVARFVQDKLRESVSVFDFMTPAQITDVQAGTALIDVTAAIQAAIDSLPNSGGKVSFPKGVYKVSSQITIANKSNIRLEGFGFSGSYNSTDYGATIKATGAFTVFSFSNGVGCVVENLQIKNSYCAIYFNGCLGFRVLDCNLRENNIGLDVTGNGVGIVRGNMVRDNTLVGMRFLASSGDTVVTENDIGGNAINVLIASGGMHLHNNMIFTSQNSGYGVGILVDGSNASANSFLSRIFITNNLIANNDLQIKILGTAFNDRDVQDVVISGNHIHQADDSGDGFNPAFAYGQGLLVVNAKRVRINHNIFTGLRDYAVKVQNAYDGIYIDHNHFRACNADAVVFDLVQWGSVDHNQFVDNGGTAIKVTCTNTGDYSQNNRFSSNSFQSNGAVYSEDSRSRANLILDNLGGTLGDFTISTTTPVSQLRHPVQGGNQQSWKNQSLYVDGAAWNGSMVILGSSHLWVDGSGRLRIKSGAPTSDTDGAIVGTQA